MGLKFNPFTGKLDFVGAGGGGSPTGPAGGDLTGTYPNPTVDGLQGNPVSNATPYNGQVLQFDGTSWVPGSIPSGGSGGGGVVYFLNFNTAADAPVTNIPQTPNTSKELAIAVDTVATSYTSANLPTASYAFLGSFVTDLNVPSATSIPAGLWDFNIYAQSSTTNVANQVYFKIEVLKYDGVNAPTLISTSGDTYIYDPTEVTQYVSSCIIPSGVTLTATDRLVVYLYGRAHQANKDITFHFGSTYPSHTHSTMPSVTGTGVVKVVNGVFQSPASTIVNADISASANIAQSKIANLTSDLSGKVSKSGDTMTGKLNLPASTSTSAGFNIGSGVAPSAPVFGDVWLTAETLFARTGTSPGSPVSIELARRNAVNTFTSNQIINYTGAAAAGLAINTTSVGGLLSPGLTVGSASNSNPAVVITQTSNGGGLRIVNATGSGESLRIEDESPETTPFVVSATGKVGIGVTPDASVCLSLDSTGVKFSDGSVQKTAMQPYTLVEHFLQGNLALNNLRNLTGGSGSSSSAMSARQYNSTGVVTLVTGTAAAISHSAMGVDQVNENAVDLSQANKNIFSSRSAFFTMPNASATGIWYSGFVDNYNAISTNGAYFRITDAGNLFAVCVANGVETPTDLGFRPATGAMHLYEVIVRGNGTAVDFWYDGGLVATIASEIPTGNTQRVNYATGIVRTSTTTTTSLEFDLDLVFVRLYNTGFTLQY